MKACSPAARLLSVGVALGLWYGAAQAGAGMAAVPAAPSQSVTENGSAPPGVQFDLESLNAKLAQVQAATGLDGDLKTRLSELYTDAVKQSESAADFGRKTAALKSSLARSAEDIGRLKADLKVAIEEQKRTQSQPNYRRVSLPELKTKLTQDRADEAAMASRLADLDKATEQLSARPAQARARLAELTQMQERLNETATLPPTESPQVLNALGAVRETTRIALSAEADLINQELLGHEARLAALKARRDLAVSELAQLTESAKRLETVVNDRQRLEAETARMEAELAERAASDKHPIVKSLAEKNAIHGRELADLAARHERAVKQRDHVAKLAKQIEEDSRTARQRLEVGGLSPTLGEILLEQRRALLAIDFENRGSAGRRRSIAELSLKQLRVEEQRRRLADAAAMRDELLSDPTAAALPADKKAEIGEELMELLGDQRKILDKLAAAYAAEIKVQGDLDFQQTELARRITSFRSFIEDRLIWIPSASVIGSANLVSAPVAIAWLLAPDNWHAALDAVLGEAQSRVPLTVASGLLLISLIAYRMRLRRYLARAAEQVRVPRTDGFEHTAAAIGATFALALAWPVCVLAVGNLLFLSTDSPEFVAALSRGLLAAGIFLFVVQFIRHVLERNGLAEAHFRWREKPISRLRANLLWAGPVLAVVVVVMVTAQWQGSVEYRLGLSPIAAFVGLSSVFAFTFRVLNPVHGVLSSWFAANPGHFAVRTRYAWFSLLLIAPVLLLVSVSLGYVYTALLFSKALFQTATLVIAVVFANEVFLRWLFVSQRRLAMKKATEQQIVDRNKEVTAEGGAVRVDSTDVDLVTVNEHTRRLVRVVFGFALLLGLWFIWSKTVPVLGVLEQVSLWSHTSTIDGQGIVQNVTLANVLFAIVIAVVVFTAAYSLPGVLEITVLQRLSMEAGVRYATTKISQYIIVTAGVFGVFGAVGVGWADVQWLVAAVSVGLGFGLQEIFANFVSGLIILFERPVRIGDTVTVGDVSGTVSRIRIRATTITDWNNKEIVVPNKIFITERLINWTLTDSTTRVVIRVGVAYGTDTDLVHGILLKTARCGSLVLPEPEPTVYFVGLGESSLDFDVRIYVHELSDRLPATHAYLTAVERALSERGIEIPFPQRDIHVRTTPPVPVSSSTGLVSPAA